MKWVVETILVNAAFEQKQEAFRSQQDQAAAILHAMQLQNERNEGFNADEAEARARTKACHYETIIINSRMTTCTVCPAGHTTTCNN